MRRPRDPLLPILFGLGAPYVLLIVAMLAANGTFVSPAHLLRAFETPELRNSLLLSLVGSTLAAVLSIWVAVPLGYLLARVRWRGKFAIELLLDVPIVLPPLVIGLCLLMLFQSAPGRWVQSFVTVSYAVPAVVLAQFAIAAAYATRAMRQAFEQQSPRTESVALTLGCNRWQAFWHVALPEVRRGLLSAFTLAWARAFGEFGPVLVFAGITRNRTEVLPTSIFLELSIGNLEGAAALSLLMIAIAGVLLALARRFEGEQS